MRCADVSRDLPRPAVEAISIVQPPANVADLVGDGVVPARRPLPTIHLRGVRLHAVTEQQTIEHILRGLDEGRGGIVMTPNLDHMRRCVRDLSFNAMLDEAELVIADGMPLVWASRLQGTPLPQRVAGSDLINSLSGAAAARGRSVFLLGGLPNSAETAAGVLKRQYPTLNVTGHHCPPMGFENDHADVAVIIAKLAAARPDIVYVALGSPKQERLIAMLRLVLPSTWWLGVGMSFSFLAGDVRRAPTWMRQCGLEWAHRLGQEPRRLFKRYVLFGIPFAAKLMADSALRGITRRLGWQAAEPALDETGFAPVIARPPVMQTPPVRMSGELAPLSLRRLRGLVLLPGSDRPNGLTTATGRSALDLPVDDSGSILNHWLMAAEQTAATVGLERLGVRVLLSRNSMEPRSAAPRFEGAYNIERDLSDYRGDGGLLARLAGDYDDQDLILVADADQILTQSLAQTAQALSRAGGLVNLVSHEDGTPSGLALMSCKALRLIRGEGFVDMKEQVYPAIAAEHEVRVLSANQPTGVPVRTLDEYIHALRQIRGGEAVVDRLAEDWEPKFSIVEAGAEVDRTAEVHDSVILAGGKVEAGAVVVRCVVCSGGTVHKDRRAMDRLVVAERDDKRRGLRTED